MEFVINVSSHASHVLLVHKFAHHVTRLKVISFSTDQTVSTCALLDSSQIKKKRNVRDASQSVLSVMQLTRESVSNANSVS